MTLGARIRKKNLRNFRSRIKYAGGPDRILGDWQIQDIHDLSFDQGIGQEYDFWCSQEKDMYLLRILRAEREGAVFYRDKWRGSPIYLIAYIGQDEINDELLTAILTGFEKVGLPRCRSKGLFLEFRNRIW